MENLFNNGPKPWNNKKSTQLIFKFQSYPYSFDLGMCACVWVCVSGASSFTSFRSHHHNDKSFHPKNAEPWIWVRIHVYKFISVRSFISTPPRHFFAHPILTFSLLNVFSHTYLGQRNSKQSLRCVWRFYQHQIRPSSSSLTEIYTSITRNIDYVQLANHLAGNGQRILN